MSVTYDDEARNAMIRFAEAQFEQIRADLIDAIDAAIEASPDMKAQLAEWSDDPEVRDFTIAAFNGYAAGFMRGYAHAKDGS